MLFYCGDGRKHGWRSGMLEMGARVADFAFEPAG